MKSTGIIRRMDDLGKNPNSKRIKKRGRNWWLILTNQKRRLS